MLHFRLNATKMRISAPQPDPPPKIAKKKKRKRKIFTMPSYFWFFFLSAKKASFPSHLRNCYIIVSLLQILFITLKGCGSERWCKNVRLKFTESTVNGLTFFRRLFYQHFNSQIKAHVLVLKGFQYLHLKFPALLVLVLTYFMLHLNLCWPRGS